MRLILLFILSSYVLSTRAQTIDESKYLYLLDLDTDSLCLDCEVSNCAAFIRKPAPKKEIRIPRITVGFTFFRPPIAEKITTKTGASSINTLALIGEVRESPLKKANMLKTIPKNEQITRSM